MGEVVIAAYALLALAGIALVVIAIVVRRRNFGILGVALLSALAGMWIIGPMGLIAGLVVVPIGRLFFGGRRQ